MSKRMEYLLGVGASAVILNWVISHASAAFTFAFK